mgnify:CR=1 FL=1
MDLFADLATHVLHISLLFLCGVELLERARINHLCGLSVKPTFHTLFVLALKLVRTLKPRLQLNQLTILEQKHFNSTINVDILHFFVDLLLLLETDVLSKLLSSE